MLNNGQKIKLVQAAGDHGSTLADYLKQRPQIFARIDTALAFANGCFLVDDHPVGPDHLLQAGRRLTFFRQPWQEPPIPGAIPCLYEDDLLLAVDKPAVMPLLPCGDFYDHSLLHVLKKRGYPAALTPIHRLDLETSGVCVFSKTRTDRGFFQKQFQQHTVIKHYHALVFGHMDPGIEVIDFPLTRHPRIHTRFVRGDGEGQPARTEIVDVAHEGGYSQVWARPITGRTNQIRAHLAGVGHPIVGDKKYHEDTSVFFEWLAHKDMTPLRARLKLDRQALHCAGMVLQHPEHGHLEITSPKEVFHLWREELMRADARQEPPT